MKKSIISYFGMFLIVITGLSMGNSSAQVLSDREPIQTEQFENLQSLGASLKDAIHRASISANLNERAPRDWDKIFRPTIEKYITVGSQFDRAETILRNAGFNINTDPTNKITPRKNVHEGYLFARKELSRSSWGYVGLYVSLYPENLNEFTTIGKIEVGYTGPMY